MEEQGSPGGVLDPAIYDTLTREALKMPGYDQHYLMSVATKVLRKSSNDNSSDSDNDSTDESDSSLDSEKPTGARRNGGGSGKDLARYMQTANLNENNTEIRQGGSSGDQMGEKKTNKDDESTGSYLTGGEKSDNSLEKEDIDESSKDRDENSTGMNGLGLGRGKRKVGVAGKSERNSEKEDNNNGGNMNKDHENDAVDKNKDGGEDSSTVHTHEGKGENVLEDTPTKKRKGGKKEDRRVAAKKKKDMVKSGRKSVEEKSKRPRKQRQGGIKQNRGKQNRGKGKKNKRSTVYKGNLTSEGNQKDAEEYGFTD